MEQKRTPELALPWSFTANSWQYTTIYDGNGVPICRFDLEDWGVDEDNQERLEARQAAVASCVVRAVNSLTGPVEALEQIAAVCADNLAPDACDHKLALRFVAEVTRRALLAAKGGQP